MPRARPRRPLPAPSTRRPEGPGDRREARQRGRGPAAGPRWSARGAFRQPRRTGDGLVPLCPLIIAEHGMAKAGVGPVGLLLRVLGAVLLVYATFNPMGHSFFHWALAPLVGMGP